MKLVLSFLLISYLFLVNFTHADVEGNLFNTTESIGTVNSAVKLALGEALLNKQKDAIIKMLNAIEEIQKLQHAFLNNDSANSNSLAKLDDLDKQIEMLVSSLNAAADLYPEELLEFLLINEIRKLSSIISMQMDLLHKIME